MQSVISTFIGLVVAMAVLLLARVAGVGLVAGIGLWVAAIFLGAFITAFLCPKKNATWLRSRMPAWIVVAVIIVLGAFVYGAAFAQFPLWLKFIIAFSMSAGSMMMIWLAPKVSRRPSV